ncbi:hypothetical protein T484DRAFT_1779611, partial [Baffinella frigidus]
MSNGDAGVDWIQQQILKWRVLVDDGVMEQASYIQRVDYLEKNNQVPEAGVGMTITERAPFKILELTKGGPAQKTGTAPLAYRQRTIKVGDILIRIDDSNIQVFSGEQVRSAIVGPVGTPVTLYFQ